MGVAGSPPRFADAWSRQGRARASGTSLRSDLGKSVSVTGTYGVLIAGGWTSSRIVVGLGEMDLAGVEELAGGRLEVTLRCGRSRPLCRGLWRESLVQGGAGRPDGVQSSGAVMVTEFRTPS